MPRALALCWIATTVLCEARAPGAPPCPPLATVADRARAAVGAGLTHPSPIWPASWPPTGPGAVRWYDFIVTPRPTGIVTYAYASPPHEVTLPLDGGEPRLLALGKSRALGVYAAQHEPPMRGMDAPQTALLQAICAGRVPDEEEAAAIREGYRLWLSRELLLRPFVKERLPTFFAWLYPPATPSPRPYRFEARQEGDTLIFVRDGKEARMAAGGRATFFRVPLRADGGEPAIWTVVARDAGASAMLVKSVAPLGVAFGTTLSSARLGIGSTRRQHWVVDVDGDGWNDIVEYESRRLDTGLEEEGPHVWRFEPENDRFHPVGRPLDRRAPRRPIGHALGRLERAIAAALHVGRVDRREVLPLYGEALPVAPAPKAAPHSLSAIGLGDGSPPFVGPGALVLVAAGEGSAATLHLAHVEAVPRERLVSTVTLGPAAPSQAPCRPLRFAREADAVVVSFMRDAHTLVEQRVAWDGKALGATVGTRELARCD